MIDPRPRPDHIDGLRGLAIGMVVLTHAWTIDPPHIWSAVWHQNKMVIDGHPSFLDYVANRGYQGVSLFLVLSGFCLSYPIWLRLRQTGRPGFSPRRFFARRAMRILPPYYAALILLMSLELLFQRQHWPALRAMGGYDLDIFNVTTHLALVHNLTPYDFSINSPFWSLALEWQWYWLFPPVLLLAIRYPLALALGALLLAIGWQSLTADLPVEASWLPGRLFEYCVGVVAARAVASGCRIAVPFLGAGIVLALAVAEFPVGTFVGDSGLYQPLYGIAFGLLVLLVCTARHARALFSWAPIVRLGVVSYSVYLIHRPVSDIVEAFAPYWLRSSEAVIPAAALAGVLCGIAFHLVVERPCLDPRNRARIEPALERLLAWTDRLYRGASAHAGPVPSGTWASRAPVTEQVP